MKIKILMVGKPANPHYAALAEDYVRRLRHYSAVEIEPVHPEKINSASAREVMEREAARLLDRLKPQDVCLALDRSGSMWDSLGLAKKMDAWLQGGRKRLCLIIGGPLGLSDTVLQRSDQILSLSAFTLAHELALVVLLEQLYRAFTILRNEKYHK